MTTAGKNKGSRWLFFFVNARISLDIPLSYDRYGDHKRHRRRPRICSSGINSTLAGTEPTSVQVRGRGRRGKTVPLGRKRG